MPIILHKLCLFRQLSLVLQVTQRIQSVMAFANFVFAVLPFCYVFLHSDHGYPNQLADDMKRNGGLFLVLNQARNSRIYRSGYVAHYFADLFSLL